MSRAETLANELLTTIDGPAFHVPHYLARQSAAELRRLAQVEAEHAALLKAISDAVPVAWIRPSGKAMLEAGGYCTVYLSGGMSNHSSPLYTLEGIRTKP